MHLPLSTRLSRLKRLHLLRAVEASSPTLHTLVRPFRWRCYARRHYLTSAAATSALCATTVSVSLCRETSQTVRRQTETETETETHRLTVTLSNLPIYKKRGRYFPNFSEVNFEIFRVHIVECLAGHVARDKVVPLLQRMRNCPLRPAIA